jgi:signal peptidase I
MDGETTGREPFEGEDGELPSFYGFGTRPPAQDDAGDPPRPAASSYPPPMSDGYPPASSTYPPASSTYPPASAASEYPPRPAVSEYPPRPAVSEYPPRPAVSAYPPPAGSGYPPPPAAYAPPPPAAYAPPPPAAYAPAPPAAYLPPPVPPHNGPTSGGPPPGYRLAPTNPFRPETEDPPARGDISHADTEQIARIGGNFGRTEESTGEHAWGRAAGAGGSGFGGVSRRPPASDEWPSGELRSGELRSGEWPSGEVRSGEWPSGEWPSGGTGEQRVPGRELERVSGDGWGSVRTGDEWATGEGALPAIRTRRAVRRIGTRDDDEGREQDGRRTMPLWQELPLLLVVAFCLAVLIRTFLLQAFYIPSSSMEETLLVGDRVLVNKIVYDVRQPHRGEVIVFRGTDNWAPENPSLPNGSLLGRIGRTLGDLVGVSRPGEKDFIKRVIGVPGDRVSCCDPDGRIYVNGKGIDEPYIHVNSALDVPMNPGTCGSRRFAEILVPPGQLFVMGDNRIVSQDSRCQGPVPIENVIGRAFVVVWPSSRWGTLGVPSSFDEVPAPVAIGGPPAGRTAGPELAGAALTLPILSSLVVTARSTRKVRWGRRTLRR